MIKSAYHKALRALAKRSSEKVKSDLPGFGYVDQFVRTYCVTPPPQRSEYLKNVWASDAHCRALERYGGIEACFYLVLGDTLLPGFLAANFATDENQQPTVRDAAVSVIQIGNFVGIPEELV